MKKDPALPARVFAKGRMYYHVSAEGPRRVWAPLSRIADGLPVMYTALAALLTQDVIEDRMPRVIADWQRDVMPAHAEKTQRDERMMCRVIAESFAEFAAADVRPPDVADFLRPLRAKPRTHNGYRAMLRELMRYSIERGLRAAESNPVADIKTMTVRARTRYITDSELRRIKVAAMRGKDGKATRSGPMLCALVDMAYLTGQRIGDLLTLEWASIGTEGILFAPAKVKASTGASVLIEWTPRLRALVDRLRAGKRRHLWTVFTTQDGQPYTYWGASTAWRRACDRAGIKAHFHDLRSKALTDKEGREGMQAARRMGAHSTEGQTADYVRHKKPQKTKATR